MHDLILAADTTVVDNKKAPQAKILAYSGGVMRVPNFGNIAIDLAGMDLPKQVTILVDHSDSISGVAGSGKVFITGGQLHVDGQLTPGSKPVDRVIELSKAGQQLQASVGVRPTKQRQIQQGQTIVVNGRAIKAPVGGLTLVEESTLKEVTICALGADPNTEVLIEAKRENMSTETTNTPDTTDIDTRRDESGDLHGHAAEAERLLAIRRVCDGKHPDIEARAIKEGWDVKAAGLEVFRANDLQAQRDARPHIPYTPTGGNYQEIKAGEVIEGAILARMGRESLGEKDLGEHVMQRSRDMGATHTLDIVKACLAVDHVIAPHDTNGMIRAAFSTTSLTTALGNVGNKVLSQSYKDTPATWRAFANIRSVKDFKENSAVKPTMGGSVQEIGPGGEFKHATMSEDVYTYRARTFGKALSINRTNLINDDLGLFNSAAEALGKMAARGVNDLVYETLLANLDCNGDAFFHADNSNYVSGSTTLLTVTSLSTGITAIALQQDSENHNLDLAARTLLVPPELAADARSILLSDYIERDADAPTGNSLKDAVDLVVEPRLSNTDLFTNASTTAWHLFASPADAALVVAFLNGVETPTIEFFGLDSDVNTLGVHWRTYFDYGVCLADPKAAYKSKGEA